MVAGTLTTIAFFPQARRILATRSTRDISLGMYALFTLGVLLWLVYGFLIGSVAVVAANAVTLILAGFILAMKLRHG
ncbi:MAG: SemiSWEET transporter [Rhodocyclaceae bacterium]|nr:SemiSWEET transporter [Rhodocyclaceae bacterium]